MGGGQPLSFIKNCSVPVISLSKAWKFSLGSAVWTHRTWSVGNVEVCKDVQLTWWALEISSIFFLFEILICSTIKPTTQGGEWLVSHNNSLLFVVTPRSLSALDCCKTKWFIQSLRTVDPRKSSTFHVGKEAVEYCVSIYLRIRKNE